MRKTNIKRPVPYYRRISNPARRTYNRRPATAPAVVKIQRIHDEVRAGKFPDIGFREAKKPLKFKSRERVTGRSGNRRCRNTRRAATTRQLGFGSRHFNFNDPAPGNFTSENVFEFK